MLNIVNGRANDVYATLSTGKAMRFLAIGREKSGISGGKNSPDADHAYLEEERYHDAQLEVGLGSDALQKKLLKIAREAQTAEEEAGVNILYVAMGYLTWFEDKSSSVPREAPLVLLPAELVRNARTSTYDVRLREEDVQTNLPLQQRLKDDFGIELPEVDIGEDWKPSHYFAEVTKVIAQRQRWTVDAVGLQLGFFSFSKLLMYRDLALESWPDGTLADHMLTRSLLYEGFGSEAPLFGSSDRLDEVLPPEKLFHVVDADASQAKVIEEVRAGRNLVVQGPPGTGKSQTITNIIATAATEGKRVLFLAEKMAALSVVHTRLVQVGLRDICLELHSRSANKKAVLSELARTISNANAPSDVSGDPTALRLTRDRLTALAEALHRPIGATGETPYSVLGRQSRFIGAHHPPPRLKGEALATMSRDDEAAMLALIARYGALLTADGHGDDHPFEGTRNLTLQPVDLARLPATLIQAREATKAFLDALRGPMQALALGEHATLSTTAPLGDLLQRLESLPTDAVELAEAMLCSPEPTRLRRVLEAGVSWRRAQDEAAHVFVAGAFECPTTKLRDALARGAQSVFARWGRAYRRASRELSGLLQGPLPKPSDRVELVDRLKSISLLRMKWEEDCDYCAGIMGDCWRDERTEFARLLAVAEWCDRLREAKVSPEAKVALELAARPNELAAMREALCRAELDVRATWEEVIRLLDLDPLILGAGGIEHVTPNAISDRFGRMAEAIDRYASWAQRAQLHHSLETAGLSDLAERMRAGKVDSTAAAVELQFARAEHLWQVALSGSPILRDIAMTKRHDLVAAFQSLERKRLGENVTAILAKHLAQVPQGAQGEMRVIRGEIGKKRGQLAIRQLFGRAGNAVQRIKPVLLMSPISVAQYLPPGALSFDLLVIDEASQVRPEDALGAIARAQQIVVVGDKKQLSPSSFFDRVLADEEDEREGDDEDLGPDLLAGAAKLGAMESILTLCEARGLSGRMLKWHYRSRVPSLIEVSNREFYENDLILPPSPLQEDPAYGLCHTHVDGTYDKGGKRDNRKEGEAIVARVAEHARAYPELSLGIVTFSFAQRNLITELLELARRSDTRLDTLLREGQREDVFVKNIENVQGDERDVILVSVGYGPATPGGKLSSMSFGPVNGEGGERRLNVLFTRARVRCEVFTSFDPGEMDVSRTVGQGPRILKRFLDFAKNKRIDDVSPTGLQADTPFEEDIADVIRSYGFLADPQVGSAGFRIDIGVRHPDKPGTYLLAVECDGATYHSALWARERDRLRQDVLEQLGWRFHRVWSTDWFYNRKVEMERLRTALVAAREAAEQGVRIDGANRGRPKPAEAQNAAPEPLQVAVIARQMPIYQRAVFPVTSPQEPHEVAVSTLSDLAQRIVVAEGPIHLEEAARRIAVCFGKEKAGSRILSATKFALTQARSRNAELLSDGDFWFTRFQQEAPPVRDRSGESGTVLKAACISNLEIDAALQIAWKDNAGGEDADLVRTAARLMGFKRVGPDLQLRIASRLSVSERTSLRMH